jgi:signal transduction histidine kinase
MDVSALIRRFFDEQARLLPPGTLLSLDVEERVGAAINAEEMEMVLRNLLQNAVLYSVGSPEISISLKGSEKRCILKFGDRGRGIEKKDLKKVFEMFYRVRGSGENIRGTGLGLYIVKTVIEDHRGNVRVESEGPGSGSTFVITLPRTDPEVKE